MAADAQDAYWFDTAPLESARRGRNPLAKLGSLLPGRQLTNAQHDALADFARANGLGYDSWIESRKRKVPLPSLVLDGTCEAMLLSDDAPAMEIGNHGWRYGKAEDDGSPSRRGYIAIRHGLELPRMYLASRGPGAATVLAAASTVVNAAGFIDLERPDPTRTPVDGFRARATRLELPPSFGFTAYVEGGDTAKRRTGLSRKAGTGAELATSREDESRAARIARATMLLDGPAAEALSELAASFDIEVEREWIYAYSSFGELSTLDPEIWAWAFGSASRMIDVLATWGADIGDATTRAWYTDEHVERPRKVDGELRALMPKQGGKIRTILFGAERG